MFGQNCSKPCRCPGEREQCHPVTGKCSCLPGYYGARCELREYSMRTNMRQVRSWLGEMWELCRRLAQFVDFHWTVEKAVSTIYLESCKYDTQQSFPFGLLTVVCLQDVQRGLLGQAASPDAAASTVVAVTPAQGSATVCPALSELTAAPVSQVTSHLPVCIPFVVVIGV